MLLEDNNNLNNNTVAICVGQSYVVLKNHKTLGKTENFE